MNLDQAKQVEELDTDPQPPTEETIEATEKEEAAAGCGSGCTCKEKPADEIKAGNQAEHSCRLESTDKFDDYRREDKDGDGKTYTVIYGHDAETDNWQAQSYRYAKDIWSEAEARGHCEEHGGTSFEPATSSEEGVEVMEKAGRALNARYTKSIESALELIQDVADADDIATRYKVLAREAARNLSDVLKDASGSDDEEKTDDKGGSLSLEVIAKQLLVMAGDAEPALLRRVALVLSETAGAIEQERESAEYRSIFEGMI